VSHLAEARDLNPRGFYSLYQGKPTPDDGEYFTREMLIGYEPSHLPRNLRYFAASDHAVTEKEQNDPVCMGVVGVDEHDDIWVMPDIVWERMETDRTVEEMIELMRRYRPGLWWAENDVIGKAIGPFLRREMRRQHVNCTIDPKTPSKDKRVRARSIQGMMSLRRVHFPKFAPWWPKAELEMLKFSSGAHDDFVDFMAWIGLGLDAEFGVKAPKPREDNVIRVGSLAWVKARTRREEQLSTLQRAANEMV
jgi:predicted phage terminase large subunit-like protein